MGMFDFLKSNNKPLVSNSPKSEHFLRYLLTTQKNEIFQILKDGGMDETLITQMEIYEDNQANQFMQMQDKEIGRSAVFVFQKKGHDSPFYFYFEDSAWHHIYYPYKGNRMAISCSSWADDYYDKNISLFAKEMFCMNHGFKGALRVWSANVINEFKAIDFWEELAKIQKYFNFEKTNYNYEQISGEEATILKKKLFLLEENICKQYGSTEELVHIIRQEFERVRNAIENMDKKTWVQFFIGVLASLALTLGVSVANNDSFWKLVKEVFGLPFRFLIGH
jgi:hypothetical protein